jgi:hypothetical protein
MDNVSTASAADVAQRIKQTGVAFFAIGIGDPRSLSGDSFMIGPFALPRIGDPERVDAAALQNLANESGGHVWIVRTDTNSTATDFSNALTRIAQSLKGSYSVGVILPSPVTPAMTAEIGVIDHPGASVLACPSLPTIPAILAKVSKSYFDG